jgi:hypothetical protein
LERSTPSHNLIPVRRPEEISIKHLKYKYPTRTPLTLECELRQIEQAVNTGIPRLDMAPIRHDTLSVVGYGPSLNETWKEITHPCISTSGAHDFLIDRGFVPDYHAQCDGRDHQVKFLSTPHPEVTYVMATVCHPRIWEQLKGFNVLLWHNCHGEHVIKWIGERDPNGLLVAGGSNIGLTAIHLGGIMGFRNFKLFGLDCNFKDFKRHADKHPDPIQQSVIRRWTDRKWFTSPQMSNAVDEFLDLAKNKELKFEVFGDSLLKDCYEQVLR